MANDDGDIRINTKLDTSQLEKGISKLRSKLDSIADNKTLKSFSQLGASVTGVQSAFSILTNVVSKTKETFKELTQAYKTQIAAETQLETAIKNNPLVSGSASKGLKDFASSIQEVTTYGDEQLLPFMAELISSGRTEQETMDIMSAAVDLSASGMMDLGAAVSSLNKTMNGNVGLLGNQISSLKGLTEEELKSGKAVEIIKKQYAGTAAEIARTTGTAQQLSNSIGDLKEELGAPLEKAMGPVRKYFQGIIDGWTSALKKAREYKEAVDAVEHNKEGATSSQVDTYLQGLEKDASKAKEIQGKLEELQSLAALEKRTKDQKKQYESLYKEVGQYIQTYLTQYKTGNITEVDALKKATDAKINEYARLQQRIGNYRTEQQLYEKEQQKAAKNSEEAARLQEEMNRRDELRKKYKDDLDAKKKEIELRRSVGEEITKEQEAQELYNIAMGNYLAMYNDPAFDSSKTKTGMWQGQQEQLEEITGYYEGISTEIQDFILDLEEKNKAFEDSTKTDIELVQEEKERLKEEYDKILANKNITEEQKAKATIEYNKAVENIDKENTAAYLKSLEERNKATEDAKKDAIQLMKEEKQELERVYKEITSAYSFSVEEREKVDKEYQKAREQIEDEIAEATKQKTLQSITDTIDALSQVISAFGNFASELSNLLSTQAQTEHDLQLAKLEKSYDEGITSEEDYLKQKEAIEKEYAKKEYEAKMWEWTASIAQIGIDTASAVVKALTVAPPLGIALASLIGALGAAQLGVAIANKPIPPSFATGGIVPGRSYSGDRVSANVNSGEMILNSKQQLELWKTANGQGASGGQDLNVSIKNYRGADTSVTPKLTERGLEIFIKETVQKGISGGEFNKSLMTANNSMSGTSYES